MILSGALSSNDGLAEPPEKGAETEVNQPGSSSSRPFDACLLRLAKSESSAKGPSEQYQTAAKLGGSRKPITKCTQSSLG